MSSPTSVVKAANQDHLIRARLLNRLGIYDGNTNISSAPADLKQSSSSSISSSLSNTNSINNNNNATNSHIHHSQPLTAAQHRRHRILRGMGVGYTLAPSLPDGSAIRSPLQGCKSVMEPLKLDGRRTSNSSSSNNNSSIATNTSSSFANSNASSGRSKKIVFMEDVEVMPIPTRYEYSDRIKSRIWSNRHELQENAERNALEFASEGWNWRNVTEDDGMYICSQSGELVHPIHLKHLVDEEEDGGGEYGPDDDTIAHNADAISPSPMEHGAPIGGDAPEEKSGGLERGAPVHCG